MKKLLLAVLLLTACGKQVKVDVTMHPAYEVTRADGMTFIMRIPGDTGDKNLTDLRMAAGCMNQVCLIKVIRLQNTVRLPKK